MDYKNITEFWKQIENNFNKKDYNMTRLSNHTRNQIKICRITDSIKNKLEKHLIYAKNK